jgi:predicted dehydrogenase
MSNYRRERLMKEQRSMTRRDFIKTSAVAGAAALAGGGVFAAGSDRIRVGLIGCGGRGTGAAKDCANSASGVEIVAMGDLFKDRLDGSYGDLKRSLGNKFKVTPATCFVGFDAYKKVIACDINMVILATPPGFRAMTLKAAVEAGKHVFMEKPAGTDPAQIRSMIASSELAKDKGLGIVAGTQRRHQKHYLDIMQRVRDGAIGEIRGGQAYWNGGDMIGYWKWWPETAELKGMEWQCRSWPWFTWTSGDHIVEQHVHNLDVIAWAIGANPVQCVGMGGRQVRTQGNIYDHFAVEFEYPNGIRIQSMCRQINGCTDNVSERVVGTKGQAYTDSSIGQIFGAKYYKYDGPNPNPYVVEHTDLIASIRKGEPINEGKRVAESTMAAIMGRMSAYTGRALKWDWAMKASKLDLLPEKLEFGPMEARPLATPGKTQLI